MSLIIVEFKRKQEFISFSLYFFFVLSSILFFQDTLFRYVSLAIMDFPT